MVTTVRDPPIVRVDSRRLVVLAPSVVALALWAVSLPVVNLRAMDDFGLISVLPPTFWLGLAVVLVSTVIFIHRDASSRLIVAQLSVLVLMLHGTPSILYHSLRYAWAWKHIGIVDYIIRRGAVAPHGTDPLTVYHSWPGFFALNAVQVGASGLPSALPYANWAEMIFGLAAMAPLWLLFDHLCRDRRQVWLALLLFYLGNWVGQDYFAPQAFCFLLFLVVLVACLRWIPAASEQARRVLLAVVLVLLFTIVSSHQLTPFMTFAALAVLVLARRVRQWWLPVVLAVMTMAWVVLMATTFVKQNMYWIVDSVGRPSSNSETFVDTSRLTLESRLVSYGDRALTGGFVLLAVLGWLRMTRRREPRLTLTLLAAAPFPLLAANDYGGEMLFRVFLFALPFLSLLTAGLVYPMADPQSVWRGIRRPLILVMALAVLFCTAYYGKERENYFSPAELSASKWLYSHAPPGAVIVAANADLPWAYTHYWTYTHQFLADLPPELRRDLGQRPLAGLEDAVGDRRPAYVILCRTQVVANSYTGDLPPDGIHSVEQALQATPGADTVYRNRDAVIYEIGIGVEL